MTAGNIMHRIARRSGQLAIFTVVFDLSPDRHTTQSAFSSSTSMILSTKTAATEYGIDVFPSPKARNVVTDFSADFACSPPEI